MNLPTHGTNRESPPACLSNVDFVSQGAWVAETDGVLEAARRLGRSRASITTRHHARPMGGGDTVVADRLDRARQAARAKATG